MIEHCPNGLMLDEVAPEDIETAYPAVSLEEITDSLAELESYGLVSSIEFQNGDGYYCLTALGYEKLDPKFMGWDPQKDARILASLVVAKTQSAAVNIAQLENSLEWSKRRFNPALRIVTMQVNPDCLDDTLQPYYVTAGIYLNRVDRARLRRFAETSFSTDY